MEVIEQQISYDLSRSFHNSNIANNREATRSMSIHSDKDDIGSSGALHGYFQFIDFVQLQDALSLYAQKQHVNSDELTAFVQLSDFLIQLRLAIIANKWFEDSSNKHIDLDPDDFATFEGTAEV